MSRLIQIVKAKLDKDGKLVVSYNEKLPEGNQRIVKDEENTTPVHNDLIEAFHALNPHLARLCEQYEKEGKLTEEIETRSFSLKGDDDAAGIVLSGIRKVANNKSFAINTPFLHWGREDNYAKMQELMEAVELCEEEVKEYLVNGKHAVDPQGDLFDEDANLQKLPKSDAPFITEPAAAELVAAASLEKDHLILIPCANTGTILKQALTTDTDMHIDYCEILPANRKILADIQGGQYVGGDFIQMESANLYDRIIAAPPRSKAQEATHLLKMWNLVKPGGRIVALVSHATLSGTKKANTRLVDWLREVNAIEKPIEAAGFDKDGKPVKALMVIIDKAA